MARDEDDKYKAGVDFEWVTAKNGNYKTRKFFTKAEKEAMKAPKKESKPASKPAAKKTAPTSSPRPKSKPASMDAGSRVGAQNRPVSTTAGLRKAAEVKSGAKTVAATPTVDKKAQRTALKSVGGGIRVSGIGARGDVNIAARNKITTDTARPSFDVNYDQWLKMTPEKRKELGLPATYGAIQRLLGTKMKTQTKNRFKFYNKED